jgi:hypothetical protein
VLILSDSTSRYAEIPAGFCLLVLPHNDNRFLAIALKTEKSKIEDGKGMKKLGIFCQCYNKKLCSICNECEKLRNNRKNFFNGTITRPEAVKNLIRISQKVLKGKTVFES